MCIRDSESTEALWYVVHTYSGYENKVANDLQTMVENRHLQDLICDIKVPVEMVPEIDKNGKQKMVEHKLFPGDVYKRQIQYLCARCKQNAKMPSRPPGRKACKKCSGNRNFPLDGWKKA